jgi:hypothetical protein
VLVLVSDVYTSYYSLKEATCSDTYYLFLLAATGAGVMNLKALFGGLA